MFLSHRIQKVVFITFTIGLISSVAYLYFVFRGITFPENTKKIWVVINAIVVCLSALLAPFTQEKQESKEVKYLRMKSLSYISALYFCLILLSYALKVVLGVFGITDISVLDAIASLKCVLLFEIAYFILLKVNISHAPHR